MGTVIFCSLPALSDGTFVKGPSRCTKTPKRQSSSWQGIALIVVLWGGVCLASHCFFDQAILLMLLTSWLSPWETAHHFILFSFPGGFPEALRMSREEEASPNLVNCIKICIDFAPMNSSSCIKIPSSNFVLYLDRVVWIVVSGLLQVSSGLLKDPFPLKRAQMEVTVEGSNFQRAYSKSWKILLLH